MVGIRFLIVGCGRSGTGFLAGAIRAGGKISGHEAVFDVYGYTGRNDLEYESSWYAAPYIRLLPRNVRILHVVRAPAPVIHSCYRIGLLADTPWQHVTFGRRVRYAVGAIRRPQVALARYGLVHAHRQFLRTHTTAFSHASEIRRLEAYWLQWNQLVEAQAAGRRDNYFRLRIEDIAEKRKDVCDFLELPSLHDAADRNLKSNYRRGAPPPIEFSEETRDLMNRYGY